MAQAQSTPGSIEATAPAARIEASAVAAGREANPAPLGLAGFAITTFLLSLVNSGVFASTLSITLGLALMYGGLAQLLAGMWEFKNGNTFGATAFSSYGAFWLSFVAYAFIFGGKDSTALAWYLLAWGFFTFYMWIATLKGDRPVMVVFLLLWITYLLLAIGGFNNAAAGTGLTQIGGYVGIVTALAAWYASARGVINPAWGRVVLPG